MPKKKDNKKSSSKNSKASMLKTLRKQFEKINKTNYDLPSQLVVNVDKDKDERATQQLDVTSWLLSTTTTSTTSTGTTSNEESGLLPSLPSKGDSDLNLRGDDDENVENGRQQQQQQHQEHQKQEQQISSSSASPSTSSSSLSPVAGTTDTSSPCATKLTLYSWSSSELHQNHPSVFEQVVKLFQDNMSDQYKKSSWGLDLQTKKDELSHFRARFLILLATTTSNDVEEGEDGEQQKQRLQPSQQQQSQHELAGFCHYRWEYDDDDDEPSSVVLYVYELQISKTWRRRGLGGRLMNVIEILVNQNPVLNDSPDTKKKKVMLTVFKSNISAMEFYMKRLHYQVDEISPSQHGLLSEDYEILSKDVIS
jgi:N-alpha-acetyltransferase 40